MEEKFQLGPLQKLWVESLRAHPERQGNYRLGKGNVTNYTACCLGELHLCAHRLANKKLPFSASGLIVSDDDEALLTRHWAEYGLYSPDGKILGEGWEEFSSLATANDQGKTWLEIADFIEQNPEKVFTRPV